MADKREQGAIGDASNPATMQTDPNGAKTAVGVSHPENRMEGSRLPAVDMPNYELDDYDDDKQESPTLDELPPDQDAGESFTDIVDVGETPGEHKARGQHPHLVNLTDEMTDTEAMKPTVDNQLNQPERFQNRYLKGPPG
jgi:hypothetical protein